MPDAIEHLEEKVPDRTTPQGTQAAGVDRGHEAVDVSYRPVARWFAGLLILMVLSQVFVWIGYRAWQAWAEARDVLPSPIFARREVAPPPRVLPNPIDSPADARAGLMGPGEYLQVFRDRENQALERAGLRTQDGQMTIPERAVRAVVSSAEAAGTPAPGTAGAPRKAKDGLTLNMPSSASGGTAMENRLR